MITEDFARKLFHKWHITINSDDSLRANHNGNYVAWFSDSGLLTLDGEFSASVLEALGWWITNKRKQ